jgi:hypothetical protein
MKLKLSNDEEAKRKLQEKLEYIPLNEEVWTIVEIFEIMPGYFKIKTS